MGGKNVGLMHRKIIEMPESFPFLNESCQPKGIMAAV